MARGKASFTGSLRNSTGNLVKLGDFLKAENYTLRKGDYIRVNVVWRSDMKKDRKKCQFILADENDHIAAVLWLNNGNTEDQNTANRLKENTKWQISNFSINPLGMNKIACRPIVSQKQELRLSSYIGDVVPIPESEPTNFLSCIPFKFTPLEKLDEHQHGSYIDIIAFVPNIVKKTNENIWEYEFSSSRSADPSVGERKEIELDRKQITKKGVVYALMNVKVKGDRRKSFDIEKNTIILRMTEDNFTKLPLEYMEQTFVLDLFPKKRSTRSNATTEDQSPPRPRALKRRSGGSEPSREMLCQYNKLRRSL